MRLLISMAWLIQPASTLLKAISSTRSLACLSSSLALLMPDLSVISTTSPLSRVSESMLMPSKWLAEVLPSSILLVANLAIFMANGPVQNFWPSGCLMSKRISALSIVALPSVSLNSSPAKWPVPLAPFRLAGMSQAIFMPPQFMSLSLTLVVTAGEVMTLELLRPQPTLVAISSGERPLSAVFSAGSTSSGRLKRV